MALCRPGTSSTLTSRSIPEGHEDWRQQENKPLQEWLESISQRMMKRIDAVGDEVENLVDECGALELDLKNTFNSFRCLSSTQFVENRVYEEDETESVKGETPANESQHSLVPTESYEDEILPRYKDAVSTAWAAFQEISHQHDEASRRLRSRNKVLRSLDYDGRLHLVPHIIGTDEFARDIHCGLAELRHKRPVVDGFEVDSDTEREGADLAAELVGAGSVSEGEWSEAESDIGNQGGGLEPAVSAALDFKAMLEAALRNPSLPYDGNSSTQAVDKYGEVDNDYFLSNMAIDNFYSSPRVVSKTVERGDHRAGDTSANTDASDRGGSWQLTRSHIPGEFAVQSTADSLGVTCSLSSQPSQDEQAHRATMEELLKKPFMLQTQRSTKEDTQNSSCSNIQVDYSSLANIPFIPGGLFDDDEDNTVSISSDLASVRDSSTEPTVPEGLFQRQPSTVASEHSNIVYRSSSSGDPNQSVSPVRVPSSTTVRQSPKLDVSNLFKNSERKGSMPLEISEPSSSIGDTDNISTRSETSHGPKGQVTSKPTVPSQIRGGLFDDSDDDEDAGDLFGKSLSIKVTDAEIHSQPALRIWTSVSSKGLFDDLEDEVVTHETRDPHPAGSSREGVTSDDLSSLLRQVSSSGSDDGRMSQRRSSWTTTSGSTAESFQKQISSSSLSENTFDRNPKQVPSSSLSGSTPTTSGKLSYTSSLAEISPDPQKQSPNYSLSRGTLNRGQEQILDAYLSGSSSDGPKRQLFGSFEGSFQKPSSVVSLVGSVPNRTSVDFSTVKTDLEDDGVKETTGEPHVNLESLLAAGIRPTARTVLSSSDNSDSWSSSGSDVDGDPSSRGKPESPKSLKGVGASTVYLESNHEEDTVREADRNKLVTHATFEDDISSSFENPEVLILEEMRRSPSSSFPPHDEFSSSSSSRPGKSVSDTQVIEVPKEQQPVKSLSSAVESVRPRLLSVDQTAKSGAVVSTITDGSEKLIHATLSRPLGPSKRRAPSPSHTLKGAQSLPERTPRGQSHPSPKKLSQTLSPRSDPNAPVLDIGWLTTGRTFTSLFDEDDGEDDLFGTDFPQKRVGSQFGSKTQEIKSPVGLPTDLQNRKQFGALGRSSPTKIRSPRNLFQTIERDEPLAWGSPPKSKSPFQLLTTGERDKSKDVVSAAKSRSPTDLDVENTGRDEAKETPFSAFSEKSQSPVQSRVLTKSPAKDLKVDDSEVPYGRSASKFSFLLFGHDDEDSEDVLFGPLREKSFRSSRE